MSFKQFEASTGGHSVGSEGVEWTHPLLLDFLVCAWKRPLFSGYVREAAQLHVDPLCG